MTSIKTGLLGLVALLALALVGPATASASAVWEHEGAPLAEHVEIGLEGSQVFITEAGGMICEADATLTATPGTTGQIGEFTSTKCQGIFGELAGCTVTNTEQPAGPWTVHVTTTDLDVEAVALVRTFNEGCPVERIESFVPAHTYLLPETTNISEIEYFGGGEASIDGGAPGEYEEIGSWFVTPAGTYGIG